METLSLDELRKTLQSILSLAECPVCSETLTPKVALCVKGHIVCEPCHKRLQQKVCPTCRSEFSPLQPSWFIRQLIEALPHQCRNKNCDYFVRTDDDHEKYCIFQPTRCRYCAWTGAEKELVKHLYSKHTELRKYLLPIIGNLENGIAFNPRIECSTFTPILVDGHFFWGEMENEPNSGKLTAIFHSVGNGKIKTVVKGSVNLGIYNANITLNLKPGVDPYVENCISIPTSIIRKCTANDKFEYRLSVEVVKIETLASLLETGIKSGIAWLKS